MPTEMTPGERIDDMHYWMVAEYEAILETWREVENPQMKGVLFGQLQLLQRVARHLITGQDDVVPLLDERLVIFTQHVDFLKRWGGISGE